MAHYRKIDTRIWNDRKFLALSDRGKLAFMFLLTHPHLTAIGAMRATAPGMAHELGWTEKAFREAFGEVLAKGMAKHDESACFVWVPNFLKYNRPESPNVVKSWSSWFDLLPECSLKSQLQQQVKAFAEGLSEGFRKALGEAFAKGMPNQEQEQEHKQEQEQQVREDAGASNPRPRFVPPTIEEVRAYCTERGNRVDPQRFVDHYTANGWKVGRNPMKCWKAAIRTTWERDLFGNGNRNQPTAGQVYDAARPLGPV